MEVDLKVIAFRKLFAFHWCNDVFKVDETADEDEKDIDVHELESETKRAHPVGFQLAKEDEDDDEDDTADNRLQQRPTAVSRAPRNLACGKDPGVRRYEGSLHSRR